MRKRSYDDNKPMVYQWIDESNHRLIRLGFEDRQWALQCCCRALATKEKEFSNKTQEKTSSNLNTQTESTNWTLNSFRYGKYSSDCWVNFLLFEKKKTKSG